MSTELPPTFGALRATILMCYHFKDNAKMSAPEIRAVMEAYADQLPVQLTGQQVSQNISALLTEKKYLHRSPSNSSTKRYMLSPLGQEVAKVLVDDPDRIPLVHHKNRKKEEPQDEIDFGTDFNVSHTAANLADGLTALIQENQGYRELMVSHRQSLLREVNRLGKTLGLNPLIESEG